VIKFLRHAIIAVLMVWLCFISAVRATELSPAAPPKLSQPNISIAISSTLLAQRAALEAAVRMGAFETEGLKIKINIFRAWSEVVQAMTSQPNVFGLTATSLVRAVVGQNAPIRQIVMVSTRYPYVYYARGDSGIKSLEDLRGKKIQTARTGETLDNVWFEVLASAGVRRDEVTRIEGFDAFGALISKTVEGANLNDVFLDKVRKAGFVMLVDYNKWREERGLTTSDGNNLGWAATQQMLDMHPDTVKAFLRAIVRGTKKLREDREFGITVLSSEPYKIPREAAGDVYDLNRNAWLARLDPAKRDFEFDIANAAAAMGIPVEKIDTARLFAPGPIAEVLAELNVAY
jgi:ABC-type nitrate/sulfonate/bicarbonate transport system substrate-binding protein